MPRLRIERRLDYHHFDQSYFAILHNYETATNPRKSVRYGPYPRKEVRRMQYQLYRFFGFLRAAPPDDEIAAHLCKLAGEISMQHDETSEGFYLDVHQNPIIQAVRQHKPEPGAS